ncbi:MAG: hypothetical protein OK454_03660 [Thaumarchaeota archaeon]|nr:hypothetical protein [Nitrososphaerota archaeon]
MYMKPEDLAQARELAERWKAVGKDQLLYGVAVLLTNLIKRGDDYKDALQSMWDVVAICEPDTLGARVFRNLLHGLSLEHMRKERNVAMDVLRDIRHELLTMHEVNQDWNGRARSRCITNIIAEIGDTLEIIAEMDKLLQPTPDGQKNIDEMREHLMPQTERPEKKDG